MPNHLHGILIIALQNETSPKKTSHRDVFTGGNACVLKAGSLGSIIGQFKSVSTKRVRAAGFSDFAWQPRFYEHIIRHEQSLDDIRQYISDNPVKWETDKDNPALLSRRPGGTSILGLGPLSIFVRQYRFIHVWKIDLRHIL